MSNFIKICSLFLGTLSFSVQSAVFNVFSDEQNQIVASISGSIVASDSYRFIQLAENYRKNGTPIKIITLHSGGGSVTGSYEIAQYIIDHNISTLIDNKAQCASACFNIFIAGKKRFAHSGSQVGVHRISDSYYGDTDSARGSSIDMNEYFRNFNVPNNIRLAMLETPPEKMYWLTNKDKQAISTATLSVSKSSRVNEQNSNDIQTFIKQAEKYYNQHNYRTGVTALEKARQLAPRNPVVLGNLGWGYGKLGKNELALKYLTQSLEIHPQNIEYWGYLAEIYADLGYLDYSTNAFIKMYQYAKDKQKAMNLLYAWSISYPNTNRDMAATNARQQLGIY